MKKTVLFGAGLVAEQNLYLNPDVIVDNNPDIHGDTFYDITVHSPSILDGKSEEYNVVICTTSVGEVRKQLISYGFKWGVNAYPADQLVEQVAISDLEDASFSFLVCSGLPSTASSFSGGGIHLVKESGDYPEIVTVYEGNTHNIIRREEGGFAFTCAGKGIVIMDDAFQITNVVEIDKGLRPHGLRQYKDGWLLVSSAQDCVIGVDKQGKEIFRHMLSDKLEHYETAQHHCNDVAVSGEYAYVSMFSATGNFKRNIFDGAVVEINLTNGEQKTIINSLTMPHNISIHDNEFYVLDSFKGTLLGKGLNKLAQLPGFLRGFDLNQEYYFLGESKNRNFSRLMPDRTPVSIDSRITIVHRKHGFSRSIPLPRKISEIHSVILL